jgi:putative acetyltransferase
MTPIGIRQETSADHEVIRELTELAFRDMAYAGGDEQDVIDRLRLCDALTLSMIAEVDGKVVGHIAFSPATLTDGSGPWFALGPVSVLPDLQRQGVGSALIKAGLAHIRNAGALGCILTGNPLYYCRFGFELAPQNVPLNESEKYFMLKLLGATEPRGSFGFHAAFYGEVC